VTYHEYFLVIRVASFVIVVNVAIYSVRALGVLDASRLTLIWRELLPLTAMQQQLNRHSAVLDYCVVSDLD